MIDLDLLALLCCPETHQPVSPADPALIQRLNQAIDAGELRNRANRIVEERIEGGLLRADGRFLYPIRHDIPIMLIEEAIPLNG